MFFPCLLIGQETSSEPPTTLSQKWFKEALELRDDEQVDSSIHYSSKAIKEGKKNQEWVIVIRSLYLRGSGLMKNQKVQEAARDFEEADDFLNQYFPDNDSLIGEGQYFRGVYFSGIKQYSEAIRYLLHAKRSYSTAYGTTHWKVGKTDGFIGMNYFFGQEYDSALYFALLSLAAIDTTSEWNLKKFELNNLDIIVRIYGMKMDHKTQLPYLVRQKVAAEKEGMDNFVVFVSYPRIAQNYMDQYDFSQALIYYQKTRTNARSLLGTGHCHKYLGEIDLALSYYQQALDFCNRWKGGNLAYIPSILHSIALLYMEQDMWESAIPYFQRVLHTSKDSPLPPLEQGMLYGNLGILLIQTAELSQADSMLREGERVMKQYFGFQHPTLANIYATQAQRFAHLSEWDSCFSYIQRSLQSVTTGFTPEDLYQNPSIEQISSKESTFELLTSKAAYIYQLYSDSSADSMLLQRAFDTYLLSFDLADSIRLRFQYTGSKEAIFQAMLPAFEQALHIASSLYQQSGNDHYLRKMFELMERSKAFSLYENLQHTQAIQFAAIPDSIQRKERQFKIDIAYYEKQLEDGLIQPNPSDPRENSQIKYTGKLYDVREAYRQFLAQLKQQYPHYHQLKYEFAVASLQEAREILPSSNSLLIEYFLGDSSCYIIGIDEHHIRTHQISIDSLWLDSLDLFISLMHGGALEMRDDAYRNLSSNLYAQLIQPILGDQSYEHLIIIPDGKLGYLPFASLTTEINPDHAPDRYGQFPYLFRQSSLQYANSATILTHTLSSSLHPFGYSSQIGGFAPSYPDSLHLSFNQREVNEAQATLGGQTFLAEKATEAQFKSKASNFPILHFAMHGYPNDEHPMLAYLAFTETEDTLEDDKLYAYEIFQLKLSAQLAVLSACHTGYGPLSKGDGIKSLGRAFHFAGCPSILISQWEATGASARLLMKHFYANLARGTSKSEALRQAQLSYLEEAPPYLRHPRYWANFALIGADEPVIRSWSVLWILVVVLVGLLGVIVVKTQQM